MTNILRVVIMSSFIVDKLDMIFLFGVIEDLFTMVTMIF